MASTTLLHTLSSTVLHGNLTALLDASRNTNLSAALLSTVKRLLDPSADQAGVGEHNWHTFLSQLLDRNPTELAAAALAIFTFLFLVVLKGPAMSWLRFGNLDRFSPFTRQPPQGSTTVSEDDYSYITNDDLKRHAAQQNSSPEPGSQQELGPPRDTDVVSLRNKRNEYLVHFPAYSIAKGELKVGQVRDAAAKKLNTDPRKVKLLYKGRNLKDDGRQCRAEGLKERSEILCSVADGALGSASETDGTDGEGEDADAGLDGGKKKRNRNNRNRKKKKAAMPGDRVDDMLNPPPSQARAPSPGKPAASQSAATDKLVALSATLRSYEQDVQAFLRNPPAETSKRVFEQKRLSETILTQVLLKTDAVETEGDIDARTRRKELVRECQHVLKVLDEATSAKG